MSQLAPRSHPAAQTRSKARRRSRGDVAVSVVITVFAVALIAAGLAGTLLSLAAR